MSGLRPALAAAVLALLAAAFAAPPLPECRIGDEAARIDPPDDGRYTVLDTLHALPADWTPPDLVSAREAGFDDDRLLRAVVVPDLRAMLSAAAQEGIRFELQSAYRSGAYQQRVFAGWVRTLGREAALQVSARPGHSEHQLGTALDLRSAGGPAPWDLSDWSDTPEGAWLHQHGWRFGFLRSYPDGAQATVCYASEPWHWRWVGRSLAERVQASGLTLREALWLRAYGVEDDP